MRLANRPGLTKSALLSVLAAALLSAACQHAGSGAPATSVCDPIGCDATETDPAFPAAMLELAIPSGGEPMNAVAYLPPGPGPHTVVVLLHGFPGYERNGDIAHALRRAGFTVLFFHYRGAWASPGHFSFAHAIEDAKAAIGFAQSKEFAAAARADARRIALVGHSMGGFVAIQAGAQQADVDCVVSMAGANMGLLGAAMADPAMRSDVAARLDAWSGPIEVAPGYSLSDELFERRVDFDLRRLAEPLENRHLLLVAGRRDEVTPPALHHDPLREAFAAQRAPGARLDAVVLDADHAFSSQRVALTRQLVDWLGAHCR